MDDTSADLSHWHTTVVDAPRCAVSKDGIDVDFAKDGATVALLKAKPINWGASRHSGEQYNPIWRATPDEL